MDSDKKWRWRWSEIPYDVKFRFRIKDWDGLKVLKVKGKRYLLVDCVQEYKDYEMELCVPYEEFVHSLLFRPVREQKLVRDGIAMVELVKLRKRNQLYGMRLEVLE